VKKKKGQIVNLWKTVFSDSEEFIQLYFSRVYKDQNAFYIEKDGQVVSALQILPYTMPFYGEEVPVAYISGACTLPAERKKGWMSTLLQSVSKEMKEQGIAISALIPSEQWLFDYYRSRGYTEIFEYSLETYSRGEYPLTAPGVIEVQQKKKMGKLIYAYFERKLRERPMCMLHSYEDFAVILKDMELSGGYFFVAYNYTNDPVGMAFVYPSENRPDTGEKTILIKEILYDNGRVKNYLLEEITSRLNVDKAVYRVPAGNGLPAYPYGMARVIDAERLIRLWIAAHLRDKLSTTDLRAMDTHSLTRHLLGYPERMAYMSLMLD
jgi:GNAT superfamily N-acetyltransferase